MCGINGILRVDPEAAPVDFEEALRTRERMASRGPDGAGLWADTAGDIVLGHRRLSIIDLSDAGLQPMASADGRYQIVFNGEIYNYRELRAELAADYQFRSHTDTEVILALFARHGTDALARLRGMFAFAIWDNLERRLLLARDPNGIKPLYYANDGKHLRFASQVKALVAGGAIATRPDPAGLCGFLMWGFVPEPWTVHESVKALPGRPFRISWAQGVAGARAPARGQRGTARRPGSAGGDRGERPGAPRLRRTRGDLPLGGPRLRHGRVNCRTQPAGAPGDDHAAVSRIRGDRRRRGPHRRRRGKGPRNATRREVGLARRVSGCLA